MDGPVKPGHDVERAMLNKVLGFVPPKRSRAFVRECPIHISNSRRAKPQSSAAPGSRGAGCAVMVFPSLAARETSPLTRCEGAERRQARGNILTPCGVRPMTLGVRLPALHCGVFLRPRDRLLEADRGAHTVRP